MSQNLQNWMDVRKHVRYYLPTKKNGARQGQNADSCVLDKPITREYVHACTISAFPRRLPIREHPERGLAHRTVDTLVILPRHRM
eukprot:6869012-Pyramimonas_sp.AAC.1